jgi:hypothetical protein
MNALFGANDSGAASERMDLSGHTAQGIGLPPSALGFNLAALQAVNLGRLNEPVEPSLGLGAAMPGVNVPQSNPRPEVARESSEKSERAKSHLRYTTNGRVFRPFRADGQFLRRYEVEFDERYVWD